MSSLHAKIERFVQNKDIKHQLQVRDLVNYQNVAASLGALSDIEILAIHKGFKQLLTDGALPPEYDMMVEALNMAILPRIANP